MFFFDHGSKPWAAKIQELTEKSGLSQSEIARRAGINRDAYGRYHNGTTKPPAQKLIMIARAFGVKPSDIDPASAALDDTEIADQPASAQKYGITPPTSGRSDRVHLSVSCELSVPTAMRIIEILQKELDDDED